jgi:hypothetical protein
MANQNALDAFPSSLREGSTLYRAEDVAGFSGEAEVLREANCARMHFLEDLK